MIQIDFFDKDIVSTLLPISTTKPDKVIFIIDKRTLTGKDPENVTRAIKNMLPGAEVEFQPVTIDDMDDIYGRLKDIIDGIENRDEIRIDLTGGTELMSACGYRISKEYGILTIYVDMRREHLINAETGEEIMPVEHISMEDCLPAIGAKRLNDSHDLPHEDEFPQVVEMCKLLFEHIEDWSKLCSHIANSVSTAGERMTVRLPSKLGKTKSGTIALVQGFMDNGFWTRTDGKTKIGFNQGDENAEKQGDEWAESIEGEYRFTSKKSKSYMTTYGTWLELFIYINALEVFKEAALGVVIDWYDGDHIDTQDNEIDVVAMRKSTPIFISCKMRKPVSGDLYEVGFVASRLGGTKAKAVLATTYPVKEMGTSPKRMYQRMKKLKVGLIEAERFNGLPPADVFNQAIQMTD